MRLCFLAAADSIHSLRWIRFFASKGHEIHWISLSPFDQNRLSNVHYYDFSGASKWTRFGKAVLQIRQLVHRIQPDVLHAHYAGSYGFLGALSGFQPYVLTAWGSDILFVGKKPIAGQMVRWALRKAKLVTCDAYHMIDAIKNLGTDERKIRLICFGVEADRFVPGVPDQKFIDQWQAGGRPVVISLRSLEPVYDIGTLLETVPLVSKAFPEILFVVCGTGSSESALKQQAADLGIGKNVHFTGRYAHAELPNMLHSSDVYVSTSLSDGGIAASTAEAMACGIPAVVSNTGENDKWIDDGKTGFLVPARSSTMLADRIVSLLRDGALRKVIGLAGRDVIVDRNDYTGEMTKMEGLYVETQSPSQRNKMTATPRAVP